MTIGQFVECIQGKICCDKGFYADATPFTNINSEDISDILQNICGMERHSNEILYNGLRKTIRHTNIYGTNLLSKIETYA